MDFVTLHHSKRDKTKNYNAMKAKANNKKEYSIVSKSETNKIYLLKKDWDDLCELITEAYNGNTDIKAVYKQMRKINPI